MAELNKNNFVSGSAPKNDGEIVVISGMSGLYPQSHHVKDLCDVLYNKVNPISSEGKHWQYSHPEVPQVAGSVPGLDRFDAQFFGVHYRLSNSMDTMSRKILEQTFQAIYDAGLSPEHISGKKVGVYIGTCFSETEKASFYVASSRTGFGIVGCSKAMFANRISYWLNAKGPSVAIDEACCSSTVSLEQAYLAMSRGECEAAVVGGANISLHPQSLVHYGRIMKLCKDGKTKSFDENADGCAKSEAINVLFLQKAKDAKRIYCDVLHVKSEFLSKEGESGPRFGFYRDPLVVTNFLETFYNEAGVSPNAVEYVEAFGSAVPEDDKAELEAISKVFCQKRNGPLLVGSVMSNIGYAEAATGISAITKVLLGYHKGELAANLHCEKPRKDIPALKDGRIRIVTEHQPFRRGYTAVNSLSVTGCNGHILLHGHYKEKDPSRYKTSIPYLVTISGRQETAVQKILDDLKSRHIDPEELALFHNIHKLKIVGHLGRGFTILDTDPNQKTISLANACEYFDDARRPLWYVYSGMGSQWPGMGVQLMRIPVFAAAIERCHKALQPKGLDIIHIITTSDKTIFDNILHSFVGIAAVQIGLTDVMRELGLVPDKIIGHSVGELGCAYADGCITAEEMILSAYSRGLVSLETEFIHGSMAAVGIGYQQIINMIPPEIEVACHNSSDSSTISGPSEVMKEFVASLTAKHIFAKEVPCSNIAYHSRYIADAGPGLLKYLSQVIKDPKPRSDRWISTSVAQDRWGESEAKYSSAEYHTNNLLNPVLFEEASRLIPANAVLVEIAPHGLLQAILKRSLPASCKHVPLTRRGHPDNSFLVLEAIGKLFMEGYNPKVEALYPKIEFPVSTGTPFLSHLVQWAHNEKWNLPLYISACRKTAAACKFNITVEDDDHKYLRGNIIKGKNVYPLAAALVTAWDTLAMTCGARKKELSVEFHDVNLFVQPLLNHQLPLKLDVALHRGTGRFEIMAGESKVAAGYIVASPKEKLQILEEADSQEEMVFNAEDIYQILYEREYLYSGSFQSIQAANDSFTEAYLDWNENWVTFIDGMLQLNVVRQEHDAISEAAHIRSLKIDVTKHVSTEKNGYNGKAVMKATVCDLYNYTRCGGIIMKDIKFRNLPPSKAFQVDLKTLKFVPRFQSEIIDIKSAMQVFLQIVAENVNKNEINIIEVNENSDNDTVVGLNIDDIPGLKVKYKLLRNKDLLQANSLNNVDLTIINQFSSNEKLMSSILPADAFVVTCVRNDDSQSNWPSPLCRIVSSYNTGDIRLSLARWKPQATPMPTKTITVLSTTDLALLLSKKESLSTDQKLLVVTTYPPIDGITDLITKWRCSRGLHVSLVMVNHKIAKDQSATQMPDLDLAFNVLQYGSWGGMYYVPHTKYREIDFTKNVSLQTERFGELRSLRWVETAESLNQRPKVKVYYAGLNLTDVKTATGVCPERQVDGSSFGMDYSGITESGVRVMGIVASGACSKWVRAIPELVWPVPEHWTLQEAATVPLAYAYALYCLGIKVEINRGSSILVHGGTGALGQAAITICLAFGMQVFVTVSDKCKKEFLMRLFPELKEDHIGCSRDSTFGDMVKGLTKGLGVQYVLNCVPGLLRNVSIKCIMPFGIVIDTAQMASNEDFNFGMFHLMGAKTYVALDFSSLLTKNNQYEMRKLHLLMAEGIVRGYVRPLSSVVYPAPEAARALRILEGSQHRGRVLLNIADGQLLAQPRITCSAGQTHILVCDDEFSGLQLADQLVSRGVRKMLLNLPKLPTTVIRKKLFWEKRGVKVIMTATNLSENKGFYSLIKDACEMGPVEGIYVVSIANHKTNREVLSGIDVVSRKLCLNLKYFAVMSMDKTFGNRICISRAQSRLPATKITIPKMSKTYHSERWPVFWRSAFDVLESAVTSNEPVICAELGSRHEQSLLEKIAAVSGIQVTENLTNETVLKDIGISEEKAGAIAVLLHDEYHVSLSVNEIVSMNVQQIKSIQQNVEDVELEEVRGLGVFFGHVDSDELMATTETVFMSTVTSCATMRDDEIDVNQTNLCIVPGLEGDCERFRELCEGIKMPALVLQPGLDYPNETVQELAGRYVKILLKKIRLNNDFYLLGYENGVAVALEMASILEDQGMQGTVYCIGASPLEFQRLLEEELSQFSSEEALQDAVIRHMYGLMLGGPCDLELGDFTWREKVERSVRALLGRAALSAQYAQAQIEAAYGRIAQARLHRPASRKLRSRIVLLRAAGREDCGEGSTVDPAESEMQQYSQQPIIEYLLRAPLAHALRDLRCSAAVNRHLAPAILEQFEGKNLCETYLMNADTFMTSQSLSDA